jgi:hypothetical protein
VRPAASQPTFAGSAVQFSLAVSDELFVQEWGMLVHGSALSVPGCHTEWRPRRIAAPMDGGQQRGGGAQCADVTMTLEATPKAPRQLFSMRQGFVTGPSFLSLDR